MCASTWNRHLPSFTSDSKEPRISLPYFMGNTSSLITSFYMKLNTNLIYWGGGWRRGGFAFNLLYLLCTSNTGCHIQPLTSMPLLCRKLWRNFMTHWKIDLREQYHQRLELSWWFCSWGTPVPGTPCSPPHQGSSHRLPYEPAHGCPGPPSCCPTCLALRPQQWRQPKVILI